jgi:hypothetical protein
MIRLYQWLHEWASSLFDTSVDLGRLTTRRVVTVEREEHLLRFHARVPVQPSAQNSQPDPRIPKPLSPRTEPGDDSFRQRLLDDHPQRSIDIDQANSSKSSFAGRTTVQNRIASQTQRNRMYSSIVPSIRSCRFLIAVMASLFASTLCVAAGQVETALRQTEVTARYLGTLESDSAVTADRDASQSPGPLAVTATTPTPAILSFHAAAIGVAAGSAQELTASFSVSGYVGNFTPTATLHYGHDYTIGAVSCTPTGASETCNVAVIFRPTLPGERKDAIFLMDGSTRLATVLLSGLGQGPLSLVQPGAFSTSVPWVPQNQYLYQSVADENGTVYILASGGYYLILAVDKNGTVTQIPTSNKYYVWTISIDGAGVLYLFNESNVVETYDTVQGTFGTYPIPNPGNDTDWYPGTIGPAGTIDIVDQIHNNGAIDMIDSSGAPTLFADLNPGVLQPDTITADSQGNVFVGGYEINKITPAGVQTQVNTVGAQEGLAVDAADTLYATRYIPLNESSQGVAMLPASDYSTPEASIDGHQSPLGMSLGSDGKVYISNYVNLDIFDRSTTETVDFGEVTAGSSKTDSSASVYNGGNQPLTISEYTLSTLSDTGFSLDFSGANECTFGIVLAPGALCQASVVFAPTHPGSFVGTISITSNSLNGTSTAQTIQLNGISYGSYDVLSPSPLVFAAQTPGTSKTLAVTMTNEGNFYASTIYSVATDNPAFTIAQGTCSGVAVQVGASCQLQVTFLPTAAQAYSGTATIVTYVSGTGQAAQTIKLPLSGISSKPPAATPVITPGTGSYTTSQQVTITDATAGAAIYYTTDGTAATTASAKYTGVIPVSNTETLNAIATATGYAQSTMATATYTFVAPAVTLTPPSVAFGNQTVNTASGSQTVTLTNSGSAALTITSVALTGPNASSFAQTNNCPASLAVGAGCHIAITFTPKSIASFSATLAVTDNASGSPDTVVLSGSGTAAPAPIAVLTPASFRFGSVGVGSTSLAQTATLKNTGNAALTIGSIAIAGANPTDFAQTNNCGGSLAPGAACQLSVTFTPGSVASFAATLKIIDNATGSPRQVALSGNGIVQAPVFTLSPTSLAFGNQVVNTTSNSLTVTLTNTSATDTVTISNETSSDAAFIDAADTCHASIAPGATCHFLMVFNPKAAKSYSATVSLTVAGVSCPGCTYPPQTFIATGNSTNIVSFSPPSLNFGNVAENDEQTISVTMTNLSKTDSIAVSDIYRSNGSPIGIAMGTCSAPVAPGATCTFAVVFNPTAIQSYSATVSVDLVQALCVCSHSYPTQTIALTGVGIAQSPVLSFSPASLDFGNQIVSTDTTLNVTVTNISTTDTVYVGDVFDTSSAAFNAYGASCMTPLAPGKSCKVQVTFIPAAIKAYSETVTFQPQSSGCGGCTRNYLAQTLPVTGTGIAPPPVMTVTPATLAFGSQAVSTSSAVQSVTLTNSSTTDSVMMSTIQVTGSPFVLQPSSCFSPIGPGKSCTIPLVFTPGAVEAYTATVTFQAQPAACAGCVNNYPAQTFGLTGTGVGTIFAISSTSLAFGNQTLNTASAAQTITLTNSSKTESVRIGRPSSSDAAFAVDSSRCALIIGPGASCAMSVAFTPSSPKPYTATASLQPIGVSCSSCSYPAQTLSFSGDGVASGPVITPSPASLDFGSQLLDSFTPLTITLTNSSKTETVLVASLSTSDSGFLYQVQNCSNAIAPGASCALMVTFSPKVAQSYRANLLFSVVDPNCSSCALPSQSIALTGTGTSPAASLLPDGLNFKTAAGTISAAQTATLSNTGSAPLTITSIALSSDPNGSFSQTNNCGASLAVGASCSFSITFSPAAPSEIHGALTITESPGSLLQSINLHGTAPVPPPPVATFTPSSLSFTAVAGTISAAQKVELSNTGGSPLTIQLISVLSVPVGLFSQTNNCGVSLAAGASCTFSVTFSPDSPHIDPGEIVVYDNASGSQQSVNLSGTATAPPAAMTISPASLDFGSQPINTSSAGQAVTLVNSSTQSVMVSSASSSDPAFATSLGNCSQALVPGASCALTVTFVPSSAKTYSATITLHVGSLSCPICGFPAQSFPVTGSALAPAATLSSSSLTFSATEGTTSAPQTITLGNSGEGLLVLAGISISGANTNTYQQTNTCPSIVSPGSSCTISITFTPLLAESYPATLVVSDNDPNSPQTTSLIGSGTTIPDFVISALTPAQSILPGGSAQFSLTVSAQNGASIPAVSLAVTGLPPGATASFSHSTVTPGSASATSTLIIKTTNSVAAVTGAAWPLATPALALTGLFFIPAKRRRRWAALGVLIVSLGGFTALSGCGGSTLPPAKSYNITISATIGAVQQTTSVQVTVK